MVLQQHIMVPAETIIITSMLAVAVKGLTNIILSYSGDNGTVKANNMDQIQRVNYKMQII